MEQLNKWQQRYGLKTINAFFWQALFRQTAHAEYGF